MGRGIETLGRASDLMGEEEGRGVLAVLVAVLISAEVDGCFADSTVPDADAIGLSFDFVGVSTSIDVVSSFSP